MKCHYKITVVSLLNFFPLEDKSLCVVWKDRKLKLSGSTTAATVKNNNADVKTVFELAQTLSPPKKKGDGTFARLPLLLSVVQVLPNKKTKDVGACELNLADFATKKTEPYSCKIKIEWTTKPGKAYDALLEKNPSQIYLLIDPRPDGQLTPQPSRIAAAAAASAPVLTVTPAAATAAATPIGAHGHSHSHPGESSNPFGASAEKSEPEPDEVHGGGSSDGEPELARSNHDHGGGSSSNSSGGGGGGGNPFASLSRRVGGGGGSESSEAMPNPSPRVSHVALDDEASTPVLRAKPTFNDAAAGGDKKLQAENKKLREQLREATERAEEKSKKVAALQAKLKQLERAVPKAAMKDLRKDGYQREGAGESDAAAAAADSGVADVVVSSVRAALEESEQPSFQTAAYWLSWALNLHNVLSLGSGSKATLADSGIDLKRAAGAAGERGTMRSFLQSLERVVEDAYRLSHRIVAHEMEALVKRKVRSYWDVEVESSAVGQDMVDLFEKWLVLLVNCNVPRSVINQWLFQALHTLNCAIFNSFVENPRLCEAAVALQLKFYVSELENWGSQHGTVLYHWRSFRPQLQPLVDLTNLMLLDKANLAVPMLRDCVPSLSLLQVKFLLDVYGDAKDSNERVPRQVLKEISDAAGMDFAQKVPPEKAMIKADKWFLLADLAKPNETRKN
jgi:hypothetical protein